MLQIIQSITNDNRTMHKKIVTDKKEYNESFLVDFGYFHLFLLLFIEKLSITPLQCIVFFLSLKLKLSPIRFLIFLSLT